MAAVRVQTTTAATYSGVATFNATFPGACTNGSHIVALFTTEDPAGTITSVADTVNTYSADSSGTGGAGTFAGWGRSSIYRAPNTSTSALTVTVVISANSHGKHIFEEWTGLGALNVQLNSTALDTTDTDDSISATTTVANCVGFRVGTYIVSSGQTVDSGWSQSFTQSGISLSYHQAEYIADAGAAATETTNFTDATNNTGWSGAMAFYELAGGGGGGGGNPWYYYAQQ